MYYPKINSLWKRECPDLPGSKGNGKLHSLIEGDYACPEFASIKTWRIQEKIDGTNVRVYLNCNGTIEIKGRTDDSSLPKKLIDHITNLNLASKKNSEFPLILYGEGFGAGIQSGGIYRKDISFILFDVFCGAWQTREEVAEYAKLFDLEQPHDFGVMIQEDIISFVKSKPKGRYNDTGYILEGVVARSEPLMRFRYRSGEPIMWKLKVKDYESL
jgi:hypothetical protein